MNRTGVARISVERSGSKTYFQELPGCAGKPMGGFGTFRTSCVFFDRKGLMISRDKSVSCGRLTFCDNLCRVVIEKPRDFFPRAELVRNHGKVDG